MAKASRSSGGSSIDPKKYWGPWWWPIIGAIVIALGLQAFQQFLYKGPERSLMLPANVAALLGGLAAIWLVRKSNQPVVKTARTLYLLVGLAAAAAIVIPRILP